jgi:hypothetical protein
MATDVSQQAPFAPDSVLTNEEIEQRTMKSSRLTFTTRILTTWARSSRSRPPVICREVPNRGLIYTDAQEVKNAYMEMSRMLAFRKPTNLRRFASGNFVSTSRSGRPRRAE